METNSQLNFFNRPFLAKFEEEQKKIRREKRLIYEKNRDEKRIIQEKINVLKSANDAGFKTIKAHENFLKKEAEKRAKKEEKERKKRAIIFAKNIEKEKTKKIKELRRNAGNQTAIIYKAEWLDYVNGNGQQYRGNRSARWGRTTQCKPVIQSIITADVVMTEGTSVFINGQRKNKINLTNYETGEVVRCDYDLSNL